MSDMKYKIGMVGNPLLPEIEWSDAQMAALRDMGMNCCQLNIAWDSRPENEMLNLEDADAEMLKKLQYRAGQLKKFGMKGLLHVGMPKIKALADDLNLSQYLTPSCIMEESTLTKNCKMMKELMLALPDVDDFMFYTYDQHAWLCSEFGSCPNCAGIPLEDRLPGFINSFKREMAAINPNAVFWWQPWELSLGQILQVLTRIDTNNFGLMLNTAGVESYFCNLDNHWIRCISYILEERGIPFIGEIQTSGSGVGVVPLQRYACPTLVYRQIGIVKELPGFCGIKEHFGYAFGATSCNMLFLKEYLQTPEASQDELLMRTAMYYGGKASELLIAAWKLAEKATDLIPYEFTYCYSNIAGLPTTHGFDFPMPEAVHADTPAWESDRRAFFFLTHDMQYHPWALENAALKLKHASVRLQKCAELINKAADAADDRKDDLHGQASDMMQMAKSCLNQYCYFTESLLACDIRTAMLQRDEKKKKLLHEKFEAVLKLDLNNQVNSEELAKKYVEFSIDPDSFFNNNYRQKERLFASSYVTGIDQRY